MVCLLRAINVGGRNKIPMADLRAALTGAGLADVASYIQSGNVAFTTDLSADDAAAKVAEVVEAEFDLTISVLARTATEVSEAIAAEPFGEPPKNDDGSAALYVAFCAVAPDQALVDAIDRSRFGDDRFVVIGREIFVRYPAGASKSKLDNAELEKLLGVTATMRNWNSTLKLAEL